MYLTELHILSGERSRSSFKVKYMGQNCSCNCGNRILKAFANSLDPDETPRSVASHLDPNSDDILADDKFPSMQRVNNNH
ncbi:hypothetical protein DPMN_083939 [Dreissena polymorpha]|uniref:Uncharacterized protein n=1 Tax=Dreissena polymorpha TaxID=45954 RepID=A0A9D4BIY3_DREPO|nr:hypothetical protein DPMN_083939 [Dreissena polymorpha]